MLMLKRLAVPLDRDVIFLAEAGEEGGSTVGINFLVDRYFPRSTRSIAWPKAAASAAFEENRDRRTIGVLEKHARTIELTAHGTSGHASAPLQSNAIGHLAAAIQAVTNVAGSDSTERDHLHVLYAARHHFSAAEAARYRSALKPDTKEARLLCVFPAKSSRASRNDCCTRRSRRRS